MLRSLVKFLFLVGIFAVSLTGAGLYQLHSWAEQPFEMGEMATVRFAKGTRLAELSGLLEDAGVVSHGLFFHLYVRIFDDYGRFQAGDYRFQEALAPRDVAKKIRDGKAFVPIAVQFTVPEGWTMNQIITRMAAVGIDTAPRLQKLARDPTLLKALNIPGKNLEGYLYPATYTYTRKPTGEDVFRDMVRTFFERLPSDYVERAKARGLTLHKAVIFASLIELETLHDDERSKVSEVIWERLKKGSSLGIDAALIYGIKNYKGDITWKHLKDAKNPYNSRIHKGLPPTPIGSPSAQSLEAVLNPTNEGFYYYVLIGDGSQRHHFSRSLSEHNRHVKLLLDAQKNKVRPVSGESGEAQ